MGLYKYLRELWKKPKKNVEKYKEYLISWRREPSILRLEHPTRLDRARSLGYKAKQGVIVVRVRVLRGGRSKSKPSGGRRPKRASLRLDLNKNYKQIAEERASRKYPNMEVLNSYYLAEDGKHYWYEVILVDREHPSVKNDKQLSQIAKQKGRAFRGLTSAGRKSRGLRNKGIGAEKLRPSKNAVYKRKINRRKRI